LLLLPFCNSAMGAPKAIKAGRLIDPSGQVIVNAVIVVESDRIVSVNAGAPPAGADIIDLSRYSVIPG
jgi:imidazolonepropionase-like amidohydrolase